MTQHGSSQQWAKAIAIILREQGKDIRGVIVDPPYVFVATEELVTRFWAPETLGPLKEGPFQLRPVPANAPALADS